MVCNRCIMVVNSIFEKHGYTPANTTLGEVVVEPGTIPGATMKLIETDLLKVGFEKIDDKKVRIIEKLKNSIVRKIHHTDYVDMKFNWSSVLVDELHLDYNYLSTLFSSVEGVTLEHYIIKQKIERVKELLFYDELNMSEIADKLGYSSVQHLSTQFKKIIGCTPSEFKKAHPKDQLRKGIDSV